METNNIKANFHSAIRETDHIFVINFFANVNFHTVGIDQFSVQYYFMVHVLSQWL